jgi:hypothetical protein
MTFFSLVNAQESFGINNIRLDMAIIKMMLCFMNRPVILCVILPLFFGGFQSMEFHPVCMHRRGRKGTARIAWVNHSGLLM